MKKPDLQKRTVYFNGPPLRIRSEYRTASG